MALPDCCDSKMTRSDDAAIVLDAIPDAYVRLDAELRFRLVNCAAERLLGRQREELVGLKPWEVCPELASGALEPGLRRALQGSGPHSFEIYYPPWKHWYAITAASDAGGLVVHLADITNKRGSEEQYRAALDATPGGMFRTTPEGRFVSANQTLAEILHYGSAEELIAIVTDTESQVWARPADRALALQIANTDGFVRGLECQLRCKDGVLIWVAVHARRVTSPDGSSLYYEGFVEDITQRRERDAALAKAEGVIRERERQLSTIYESVADALFLVAVEPGGQYRFITVNKTFLGLTGLTVEQVAGKLAQETIPEPSLSLVLEKYRQAVAEKAVVRWEESTLYPAGVRHGDVTLTPIIDETGVCTHLVGTVHDQTEARRTALEKEHLREQLRQAQKLESVGRLAGGIAHDFNNLLTVINGYAEFLADQLSSRDPLRLYAMEIGKAGEHAASLTTQLLAFSRKQVIHPRPVDLNAVIREAERMLSRLIAENIDLMVRPSPDPAWVMVDHAQIQQVIVNVVANARDAMPQGGRVEISVEIAQVGEEEVSAYAGAIAGIYVVTTVRDTGTGMSEEVLSNIFEPFFTTKEQGKGSGLGLATVYGIIRQSGGWVDVDSREGEGTCFRIYLPRIDARSGSSDDRRAPPLEAGATILVVEDQDAVRELTALSLENLGYHVLQAESGTRACVVAAEFPGDIDLLLTDVVMPGMKGTELAEELRRVRPTIKVLLMSGYAEEAIFGKDSAESAIPFIAKPFRQETLAQKIREVLRKE